MRAIRCTLIGGEFGFTDGDMGVLMYFKGLFAFLIHILKALDPFSGYYT